MYLFVYGTMKKGFPNHTRLDMAKFLGAVKTVEKYAMYPRDDNYCPCVIKEENKVHIKGELYEVFFQDQIDHIDRFEGVPNYYIRETIEVEILGTKEVVNADIYFYNPQNDDKYDISRLIDKW